MRLPTDPSRLTSCLLLLLIVLGSACSEACPRVAIAGLVTPLPQPLPGPGISLQELPPLGVAGVSADGPHGGTLMAIAARSFLAEHGEVLPLWEPPHAPDLDDVASCVTAHLLQLTDLLQALSRSQGKGGPPSAATSQAAAALRALAHNLDAVLRGLSLADDGDGDGDGDEERLVNARSAVLLQEQAQQRLRAGTLGAPGAPDAPPPLLVYDAAREIP